MPAAPCTFQVGYPAALYSHIRNTFAMRSIAKLAIALFTLSLAAGCGGGGGSFANTFGRRTRSDQQ